MNKPILKGMDNRKKRWSKTEPTKYGSKTTCVREINGGFIVEVSTEEEKDGKYDYTCEESFSETNPLDDSNLESTVISLLEKIMK
jgi:hypothetical protein